MGYGKESIRILKYAREGGKRRRDKEGQIVYPYQLCKECRMKIGYKKKISMLLIASMMISAIEIPVSAAGMRLKSEGSATQMASEEEMVYLNSYDSNTRTQNFDSNWKFHLGDVGNAQDPLFDDSLWESIILPHDYSITQEYSRSGEAESGYLPGGTGWYRKSFSIPGGAGKRVRIDFGGVYMNATVYVNGKKAGTHPYGYTPFSFDITDHLKFDEDNIIAIKTEHKFPSSRWYSGSGIYRSVELTVTDSVYVDLYGTKIETPHLKTEKGGSVTVNIDTTIANDGDVSEEIQLKHMVVPKNAPDVSNAVGSIQVPSITVDAGNTKKVTSTLQAENPQLWSLTNPNLYLLRTEVVKDGMTIDTYDTEFGFRYIEFDVNRGFFLNGKGEKLKGVCMHHDQGALGASAYYRAMERQIEILKEMGCNAIRMSHNPADKRFLEICNEKGMLVIEEFYDTWTSPKNGNVNDFSKWFGRTIESGNTIESGIPGTMTWGEFDLKTTIRRGYNHPSIIMWSLGNEVMEGIASGVEGYPRTTQKLIDWAREIDTTRPVTIGDNKLKAGWKESKEIGNKLTAAGGTVGFNYTVGAGTNSLDSYHRDYPNWMMYGAETASSINSRGIYNFRGNISKNKQRTAYDESSVGWGHRASDAWYTVITRDYVAGEFVWTGFDYLGEPTPWNGTGSGAMADWPAPKSSYFGIIDTAGFPKDSYYQYQSQWNDDVNTLHILPAWNENVVYKENGNRVKVVVYSDAPAVELFFTPKGSDVPRSLGKKAFTQKETPEGYRYQIYEGEGKSSKEHENLYLFWMVPYEDGTITAKAYTNADGSTEITDTQGRSYVTTTGKAAKLAAAADRETIKADGQDLVYVTVDVTDEAGNIVPNAANRVTFTVEGDGELVGVDNGNSPDHDSYQADNRRAFSGKVLAIVRSTKEAGNFTVTASAEGLESSGVVVSTVPLVDVPGAGQGVKGYRMSKNYYVKTGNMPQLPETVKVYYENGTEGEQSVTWTDIPEADIQKAGTFVLKGRLEGGIKISVNIGMIDDVAALLNYSTAVQTGGKPALPSARPAVMEDGSILNVRFPVVWESENQNDFETPGIVRIRGSADVFGKEIEVTADIRVSDEEITIGSNVAPKALKLEQDIPTGQQSDRLQAIIDGSTTYLPVSGSQTNESCWTNKEFTQNGGTKSEIRFTYATAERLGQAVIYFVEDGDEIRLPSSVELFYSKAGTQESDWIEIPVKAEAGEAVGKVIPYTYTFNAPVEAVLFKMILTNSADTLESGRKPYTGITETRLMRAVGNFTVYSDAQLSSLILNGEQVPQTALSKGSYSTPALFAETIEAVAMNNGALTILPAFEDKVHILIEAEDHSRQEKFMIHLSRVPEIDPEDGSRDYDRTKITAAAKSYQKPQGLSPDKVVDGDPDTIWHTEWRKVTPLKDRWIILELEEVIELDALRYLSKDGRGDGDNNGRINQYKVEVSSDGTEWTTVSQGRWEDQPGWKIALFQDTVTAKYVKLHGVETYGDEARDKYMNGAEIRVRKALPTIDLAHGAEVTMDYDEVEMGEEGVPVKPAVYVTVDGKALKYGLDYTTSFENNTKVGKAAVVVKGILKYSGTVRKEFTILEKGSQEVSVAGGRITRIDHEPYEGDPAVKLAPGHMITVEADVAVEGKVFSHWRVIPAQTEIIGATKPKTTFMVPNSACRLIAIYKHEDGSTGSAEVLSQSVPGNWFAYADEKALEVILAEVLTEQDRQNVLDGSAVQVVKTIQRQEKAGTLVQTDASYEAGYHKATPSTAEYRKATPPQASEAVDVTRVIKEELPDTDRIGFFINTKLNKTTKDDSGSTTEQAVSSSGAVIRFQLPEQDRNMKNYYILSCTMDGDTVVTQEIIPEVNEDIVSFYAHTKGTYALVYTVYHTVKFVDYDGRIISEQRVVHMEGAEAPEEPYREGYQFSGWSEEFQSVTKDITVKALYEKELPPKPEADKAKLEAKIDQIKQLLLNMKPSHYTSMSWKKLDLALSAAIEVLEDDTASQSKTDKVLKALEDAWNGLKKIPESSDSQDSSGMTDNKRSTIPLSKGTWSRSDQGWRFRMDDGSYAANQWVYIEYMGVKEWYFFGKDGLMHTGWIKDEKEDVYYLSPKDGTENGRLHTGWNWITGEDGVVRCYYFQEKSDGARGRLWRTTVTPDGYQVNEHGQWIVDKTVQTR